MDFNLKNKYFIVGGAGSGFGRAISERLASEGAQVLAVSRTEDKLKSLSVNYPNNIDYICGNIMNCEVQQLILERCSKHEIYGVVFNASGPPAGGISDVNMDMWDEAWNSIVRWKIDFTYKLLPILKEQDSARLLYIESISVKEPIKNLVLSNALRPAIVGFVKTLSKEVAQCGVNANILAPGYHSTSAMERLFLKKSNSEGISIPEAKALFESEIPAGKMGKPEEMASIACWLLSPLSRYVTGQTISHDGGMTNSIFG